MMCWKIGVRPLYGRYLREGPRAAPPRRLKHDTGARV